MNIIDSIANSATVFVAQQAAQHVSAGFQRDNEAAQM